MEKVIWVFDTETTGAEPPDAAVCELAACPVSIKGKVMAEKAISTLINPQHTMPADCRAVHHLSDQDLEGAPAMAEVMKKKFKVMVGATLAAHNMEFDHRFMKPFLTGLEVLLCTYRIARHLYPDAPNFKNQTLRYYLNVDVPDKYLAGLAPHRARYDAVCTAYILGHFLQDHTVEELLHLTSAPCLLKTIGFGVHRGKLWSAVPPDYLGWVLSKDFEPDVKFTAKHWLKAPRT